MYEMEGPQLGAPSGRRFLGDTGWSDLYCQGGPVGTPRLPALYRFQIAPESRIRPDCV